MHNVFIQNVSGRLFAISVEHSTTLGEFLQMIAVVLLLSPTSLPSPPPPSCFPSSPLFPSADHF